MTDLQLLNKNWIQVQEQTFRRWCNSKLQSHNKKPELHNLSKDFHNGLNLIYLLESLTEKPFPYDYFRVCKYELHSQENISLCIKFLKEQKVKIVNLDFKDIYEGNLKLILGLIWKIIKSYDIFSSKGGEAVISDKDVTKDLLNWCNKILKDYDMSMVNFSNWGNGTHFEALIHSLKHEGAENFAVNKDETAEERVEKAMKIAEDHHYIPKLMDAEDLLHGIDKISTMTYVAMIRNEFESGPQKRLEKKRLIPVIENSTLTLAENQSGCLTKLNVQLKNFEGNNLSHCNNLNEIRIEAVLQPFGNDGVKNPFVITANTVIDKEGKYISALLTDVPGIYEINAYLNDEEFGQKINFEIKKISAKFIKENLTVPTESKFVVEFQIQDNENIPLNGISIKATAQNNDSFSESIEIENINHISGSNYAFDHQIDSPSIFTFEGRVRGQNFENVAKIVAKKPLYKVNWGNFKECNFGECHEFEIVAESSEGEPMEISQPFVDFWGRGSVSLDEKNFNGGNNDTKISEENQKMVENEEKIKIEENNQNMVEKMADNDQKIITDNDQKMAENDQKMAENVEKMAENEKIMTDDDQKMTDNDQKMTDNDQNNQKMIGNDQKMTDNNQKMTDNEKMIENDQKMTENDQKMTENEKIMTDKDQKMTDNNQKMTDNEQKMTDNDQKMTENDQKMTENEKIMTDKDQKMTDNNQKMTDNDQKMTDNDQKMTDNDQNLTVKMVEITEIEENKEEKSNIDWTIEKTNNSKFVVKWTPFKAGRCNIEFKANENSEPFFTKKVNVVFVSSAKTSKLKNIESSRKLFEGISTSKLQLNLYTITGTPLPFTPSLENIKLTWKKTDDIKIDKEQVTTSIKPSETPGVLICDFLPKIKGEYLVNVEIDGEPLKQPAIRLLYIDKPLWKLKGAFKNSGPNISQEVSLEHLDLSGEKIPSNEMIKLQIIWKENDEKKENSIFAQGSKTEKTLKWTPQIVAVYDLFIFIENIRVYEFESIRIRNPIDLQKSNLSLKSTLSIEINVPYSVELSLCDSRGLLVGQGGDEKFLSAKLSHNSNISIATSSFSPTYDSFSPSFQSRQNGVYTFKAVFPDFALYHIEAFYNDQPLGTPIEINVLPTDFAKGLPPEKISSVGDNNAFLQCFLKYAKKGISVRKYRHKSNLFKSKYSVGLLKIVDERLMNMAIEYKQLHTELIRVSSISKGKRTSLLRGQDVEQALCFSVVTDERSIDFATNTEEERDIWVRGLSLSLELKEVRKNSIYFGGKM